jgi:predicted transcriptional regulator
MLKYFRIACEQSGREEEMRWYRIIMKTYIDEERKTAEQIAEEEHIERRTVYKNINAAIKPLSALIFGIDSLKLY